MPRVKRNIIVKRAGEVVRDTRVATRVAPKVKVKVRAANVNEWGMTKTEQRLATPMPTRVDLTKAQWREWGEGLHTLRLYGVPQSELFSLNEQRDLIDTIRHNSMYYGAIASR